MFHCAQQLQKLTQMKCYMPSLESSAKATKMTGMFGWHYANKYKSSCPDIGLFSYNYCKVGAILWRPHLWILRKLDLTAWLTLIANCKIVWVFFGAQFLDKSKLCDSECCNIRVKKDNELRRPNVIFSSLFFFFEA